MELLLIGLAYLIGSIPSGYLIARFYGIEDIRSHGSGNIGATNVARILGAKFFFIVFSADFFKAFCFITLMQSLCYAQISVMLAGLALIFGNGASIFLQFRGGKAVATSCGVLSAINPLLVIAVFIPWLLGLWVTKRVGIASGIAYCVLPLFASCAHNAFLLVPCTLLISLWGIFLHRSNIRQFLASSASF